VVGAKSRYSEPWPDAAHVSHNVREDIGVRSNNGWRWNFIPDPRNRTAHKTPLLWKPAWGFINEAHGAHSWLRNKCSFFVHFHRRMYSLN
jgi:hypothetical protein